VLKLKARNFYNLPAKMPTKDLQWVYNTQNVDFIKDVLKKYFLGDKNFLKKVKFVQKAHKTNGE